VWIIRFTIATPLRGLEFARTFIIYQLSLLMGETEMEYRLHLVVFLVGFLAIALAVPNTLAAETKAEETAIHLAKEETLAKGMFLVAARTMPDPRFRRTVILLLAYDDSGAMGVIINRPTGVFLPQVLSQIEGLEARSDAISYGGPVAMNVVILLLRHQKLPDESGHVMADVYYSASRDTLEKMLKGSKSSKELRLFFGHAGWAPGQLEAEMKNGDWHLLEADPQTIFEEDPDDIWPALIKRSAPRGIQAKKGDFGVEMPGLRIARTIFLVLYN